MRLSDGLLLVVDAAEGIMVVTERAVRQAIQEGLSITLIISKVGPGWGHRGAEGQDGCVCLCCDVWLGLTLAEGSQHSAIMDVCETQPSCAGSLRSPGSAHCLLLCGLGYPTQLRAC